MAVVPQLSLGGLFHNAASLGGGMMTRRELLILACINKDADHALIAVLAEQTSRAGYTRLHCAAAHGNATRTQQLLQARAHVGARAGPRSETPLHTACRMLPGVGRHIAHLLQASLLRLAGQQDTREDVWSVAGSSECGLPASRQVGLLLLRALARDAELEHGWVPGPRSPLARVRRAPRWWTHHAAPHSVTRPLLSALRAAGRRFVPALLEAGAAVDPWGLLSASTWMVRWGAAVVRKGEGMTPPAVRPAGPTPPALDVPYTPDSHAALPRAGLSAAAPAEQGRGEVVAQEEHWDEEEQGGYDPITLTDSLPLLAAGHVKPRVQRGPPRSRRDTPADLTSLRKRRAVKRREQDRARNRAAKWLGQGRILDSYEMGEVTFYNHRTVDDYDDDDDDDDDDYHRGCPCCRYWDDDRRWVEEEYEEVGWGYWGEGEPPIPLEPHTAPALDWFSPSSLVRPGLGGTAGADELEDREHGEAEEGDDDPTTHTDSLPLLTAGRAKPRVQRGPPRSRRDTPADLTSLRKRRDVKRREKGRGRDRAAKWLGHQGSAEVDEETTSRWLQLMLEEMEQVEDEMEEEMVVV